MSAPTRDLLVENARLRAKLDLLLTACRHEHGRPGDYWQSECPICQAIDAITAPPVAAGEG